MHERGCRGQGGPSLHNPSSTGQHAVSAERTHYEILEVPWDAAIDEIRTAYRRLARVHHPDAGGSEAVFKGINAAYETLSQPHLRVEYDEWLRSGRPAPSPWVPDQRPTTKRVDVAGIIALLVILASLSHYGYVLFFAKMNVLERLAAAVILPPLYCIGIGVVIYLANRS